MFSNTKNNFIKIKEYFQNSQLTNVKNQLLFLLISRSIRYSVLNTIIEWKKNTSLLSITTKSKY